MQDQSYSRMDRQVKEEDYVQGVTFVTPKIIGLLLYDVS
jgi:hypothetical protein